MVNSLDGVQVGSNSLNGVGVCANPSAKSIDKTRALRFQHHCVSSIGGFFGAYAVINYHDMLASAQTSNLINVVLALLGGNVSGFLIRVGALLLYVLGFFITLAVPKYTKINLQKLSLIVDAVAVVVVSLMPSGIDDVISLYPIFFAMAIQWNSFVTVENYSSATIFSTNNLKQATTSLMEYFLNNRQDPKKLDKSRFYGGSILGYHLGVALAFCACKVLGSMGVWLCIVPIVVSLVSNLRVCKSND
jgi:uncharacterized membrane protein YoaK (UPF0700 family)